MKFFNVKDTSDDTIIIASTRPELLCACKTIIVNEEDERYTESYWKKNNCSAYQTSEVEIKTSSFSSKMEFGSGAVMVCSYGDQNDVALFRELQARRSNSYWS